MYPSIDEAHRILEEAEKLNKGPWINHVKINAKCAKAIAKKIGLNEEKAYVLGLLHDIGRRYGISYFAHVSKGYKFMMDNGYDEVAKVCLTHSFPTKDISEYAGDRDVTIDELNYYRDLLLNTEYDVYDELIILCDCLAGTEGVLNIEDRMNDVEKRYGNYKMEKRKRNREIFNNFQNLVGKDLYEFLQENNI